MQIVKNANNFKLFCNKNFVNTFLFIYKFKKKDFLLVVYIQTIKTKMEIIFYRRLFLTISRVIPMISRILYFNILTKICIILNSFYTFSRSFFICIFSSFNSLYGHIFPMKVIWKIISVWFSNPNSSSFTMTICC